MKINQNESISASSVQRSNHTERKGITFLAKSSYFFNLLPVNQRLIKKIDDKNAWKSQIFFVIESIKCKTSRILLLHIFRHF